MNDFGSIRELRVGLTVSHNADITPRLIHARALLPSIRDRIVTAHCIKMIAAVEPTDHIYKVMQRAQTVVCPRS